MKIDDTAHINKHRQDFFKCFFCQKTFCKICDIGFKKYNVIAPDTDYIHRCFQCCKKKPRSYTCKHIEEDCKNCEHPFNLDLRRVSAILMWDNFATEYWDQDFERVIDGHI